MFLHIMHLSEGNNLEPVPEKPPLKHRLILALIPLAALLVRLMTMTIRVRLIDPHRHAPSAVKSRSVIYAFWHEHQLLAMSFFRGFGIHVLVSRSKDGDYIARALEWFDFHTVRSSTSSGKVAALRGLARVIKEGFHAAITPDGPRGPRQTCQPGPVFLAAMTGAPIVPFGCAVNRGWRLNSWDRFIIPQPFSKAAIVYGAPIFIPAKLTAESAEAAVKALETTLRGLEAQALQELARKQERP
jgi:hypothetical protein